VTNNGTAPAARLGDLDQNSENIIAAGDRVAITTARRQEAGNNAQPQRLMMPSSGEHSSVTKYFPRQGGQT
jgi:hypothetical protein